MKTIRSITDIERLKEMSRIPSEYVSAIASEFTDWFQAEGTGESLQSFEMPHHACMYHLEDKQDISFLLNQIINIEFVEREELNECVYFRIGMMMDHQMNLVYFLEGTIDETFEVWLAR